MNTAQDFDMIFSHYVRDIESALPAVLTAFRQLRDSRKYSGSGLEFDLVWPSLAASHPRLIHIFRKYFLELAILIERLDIEEEQADEASQPAREEDWGADDDDDEDERPSTPDQVLIERLRAERPDLFEHFRQFMFMPVGIEDYMLVEREVGDE